MKSSDAFSEAVEACRLAQTFKTLVRDVPTWMAASALTSAIEHVLDAAPSKSARSHGVFVVRDGLQNHGAVIPRSLEDRLAIVRDYLLVLETMARMRASDPVDFAAVELSLPDEGLADALARCQRLLTNQ